MFVYVYKRNVNWVGRSRIMGASPLLHILFEKGKTYANIGVG